MPGSGTGATRTAMLELDCDEAASLLSVVYLLTLFSGFYYTQFADIY